MSKAFKISLAANIISSGLLVWYGSHACYPGRVFSDPLLAENKTAEASQASSGLLEIGQTSAKTFRWSQLESSDYRIYIANLRAIGCPEQTIRDIVTADLDTRYSSRRDELERKKAAQLNSSSFADFETRHKLEAGLQELRNEEASVISTLLGPTTNSAKIAAGRLNSFSNERKRFQSFVPKMPMVFQGTEPTAMSLDSRQAGVIASLREKFEAEIGGPNQNPGDPAYLERWQAAQRNSDDFLRGLLGSRFFIEYQLQAGTRPSQPDRAR